MVLFHAYCVWLGFVLGLMQTGSSEKTYSKVSLQRQRLTDVPHELPATVEELVLSNNMLTKIRNDTFLCLNRLRILDLSYNNIRVLEERAFVGLSALTSLSLYRNNIPLTPTGYLPQLFSPLVSLSCLNIEHNFHNFDKFHRAVNFPEDSFIQLRSLTELHIDLLPNTALGKSLQQMKRLQRLAVSCGDLSVPLRNDTFRSLSSAPITHLVVTCNYAEQGALSPLRQLTDVRMDGQGLDRSLALLSTLRYKKLNSLDMSRVHVFWGVAWGSEDSFSLTKNNTEHLGTICVKHLSLGRNGILKIDTDAIVNFQFPDCLETLSLADNDLQIATTAWTFLAMRRFKNLRQLDVSSHHRIRDPRRLKRNTFPQVQVFFPPKLEVLNVSYLIGSNGRPTPLTVLSADHLRVLDVSWPENLCCNFKIKGFENLSVLNISHFDCSALLLDFFEQFPSLQELVASWSRMSIGLEQDHSGEVFRFSTQLQRMDLSSNGLTRIHRNLFQPLVNLKYLDLSDNKFVNLPEAVLILTALKTLDMSMNAMRSLSRRDTKFLAGSNQSVVLLLNNNPLLCTCKTSEFVTWAVGHPSSLKLEDGLNCSLESGALTNLIDLRDGIKDFNVKCVSKAWLIFSVAGCCVLVMFLVAASFVYRYRRYICAWWQIHRRAGPPDDYQPLENQYQFDVFVGYSHVDYRFACFDIRRFLEEEHSYTTCLHHRDFPAGTYIVDSIIEAINNSRKIILVVSQAYLVSEWCELEIRLARMRISRDGIPNTLIIILMADVQPRDLPRSLHSLWEEIVFAIWSADPDEQAVVWDKLANAMR